MALDKYGKCLCAGHNVNELMEDFKKQFYFNGTKHEEIQIGNKKLLKEEFVRQMKEIGVKEEIIDQSLLRGSYSYYNNNGKGEVKWCPECDRLRQTSCCACGCGSCEVCGHRWSCYGWESNANQTLLPFIK